VCVDCPGQLARDLDGAFSEFLAHHQDLVYGIALRSTHRPADAEELAQDAFVRAYRALAGYDAERIAELRLRGWLATIVANLGRNRARRTQPATAALDAVPEHAQADGAARPEQVAERHEAARLWGRRLATLPPRYRRAVELRHVAGLSYPELATALGRPVGTVKSDVHRGVKLLRAAMLSEDVVGRSREGST
jgi:RNA polymerase sigma-70 factor (ECF subfamily)